MNAWRYGWHCFWRDWHRWRAKRAKRIWLWHEHWATRHSWDANNILDAEIKMRTEVP